MAAEAERQALARARWEPHHRRGEWAVVNETGNALMAALAPADGEHFLTIKPEQQEYRLVGPGEGLPVQWAHRRSPSKYARVVVRWVDANSHHRLEKTVTLKRLEPPVMLFG
ncbi:hypothetical protein [Clavibacter tessellarius]|uniref:hypothetical protein n=1 Tax=Clavibacter tessellarius TaxID=31965 RepID=UPI0032432A66